MEEELIKNLEARQKKTKNNMNPRKKKSKKTNEKHEKAPKVQFKKSKLKIIPLGGLLEIGKNITVFEYENDIILVDCGLAFPEDDMLGIDLVIPDLAYLEKNKDKIKGLVITHGHEDHIGAIPYLLKQFNIPIYATKLTIGLIEHKLEEHKLLRSSKLKIVNPGQTIKRVKFASRSRIGRNDHRSSHIVVKVSDGKAQETVKEAK